MQHGTEGRPRKAAGKARRDMTAERLESMGYNELEVAAILEMIEEVRQAR